MTEISEIAQLLNLNPAYILVAITGTYLFTYYDKNSKLKRIYPLIPVVIGIIIVSLFTQWETGWLVNGIIHGAASTWIYDVVASLRKGSK